MFGQFAYSFYGNSYVASFNTREEAAAAGIAAAQKMIDPPATIYVAHLVPADPATCGHADPVINQMRLRARIAGWEGSMDYLKQVTEHEAAELDDMLSQTILAWLKKNDLLPRTDLPRAISEHPVPTSPEIEQSGKSNEVTDIGVSDYSSM